MAGGVTCAWGPDWGMLHSMSLGRTSYVICRAWCKMKMQGLLFRKPLVPAFCGLALDLSWWFFKICYLTPCSLGIGIIIDPRRLLGLCLSPWRGSRWPKVCSGEAGMQWEGHTWVEALRPWHSTVWWRGGGDPQVDASGIFLRHGMLIIHSWKLERICVVASLSVLCMRTLGG